MRTTLTVDDCIAKAPRERVRCAWPSGRWGSLPLEDGVEAADRAELEATALTFEPLAWSPPVARSPRRTAERFPRFAG